MPTLYLIDGHAQFFRAFHAIRTPMSSPVTKEPTNATFGFIGMLLKLLRENKPDYLAVAIDVSGDKETFRSEIYPEYKAHREPPPDTLWPQVDRMIAVLREIGVPVVGVEGFEADDAIATLVKKLSAEHPDLTIRIVSKDKDLEQLLVPGKVELYDVPTGTLITAESLKAEKGIEPRQVIDVLALMGDTVDNVPGVEGIGPKTASQLIAQLGSLDRVIEEAHKEKGAITGKRREKIRAAADAGLLNLSRRLVELRHDAPVSLDLDSARVAGLKLDRLLPVLRELGFNRYQQEVKDLMGSAGSAASTSPAAERASGTAPVTDDLASPLATEGKAVPTPVGAEAASAASAPSAPSPRRTSSSRSREESGASLFDASPDPAPAKLLARPAGDLPPYRCITDSAALSKLVREMAAAAVVSIDTETTGLAPLSSQLCGISIALGDASGAPAGLPAYIPLLCPVSDDAAPKPLPRDVVFDALRPVISDPRKPKCGHNLKFDMLVLRHAGLELKGVDNGFDSMVASYLIDASRSSHGLKNLALAYLNYTQTQLVELIGSGKSQITFDQVPLHLAAPYAADDALVALRLREVMLPQLRAMQLIELFQTVEMPLVEVLAELEWNGILVDPDELDRQAARLQTRIDELRRRIIEAAPRPFNPDSPRQLGEILFNKPDAPEPGLGIKPPKRTRTGYSTDAEVLDKLAADDTIASPIPGLLLEYRQLTKLVSTYLIALKEAINPTTKRIHASFHQTVAATGRLASSDPNLQNIPIRTDVGREIRRAFVAPPGCVLISADYSQIELRLLAHLSRDPALIEAFRRDEDIHAAVAAQIHNVPLDKVTREQRNSAKMVNFGIVYGVTPYGLARRLGISTTEAADIIDGYKRRFAGITTFLQECIDHAVRYGYVETILKRRRPIPDIQARHPQLRALAERTAINSVVQGSAADLIKVAMVDLHARFSDHAEHRRTGATNEPALPGVRMLLQIHDELVFECPESSAAQARSIIVDRMESAMKLDVPLKVDSSVGRNWHETK